jgi:hypothetical protein
MNGFQIDMWYDEMGLCVHNISIIQGSMVNTMGMQESSMRSFEEKKIKK